MPQRVTVKNAWMLNYADVYTIPGTTGFALLNTLLLFSASENIQQL